MAAQRVELRKQNFSNGRGGVPWALGYHLNISSPQAVMLGGTLRAPWNTVEIPLPDAL